MQIIELKAHDRNLSGTRAAMDVRAKSLVPCVVYGGKSNYHVAVEPAELKALIYTPEFRIAQLNTSSGPVKVFVKEIQFHPITDQINHIDFMELVPGKEVVVEVPVHLEGYAVGVKSGGKLNQRIRKIKISGSPENLVNKINVDVTAIELGTTMRVKDIKLPEGIKIITDPAIPVAGVIIPRALKEEEKPGATATPAAASAAAPAKAAAAPAAAPKAAAPKKEGGKK
mgnify:CR=1 FL=1